MSPGVEPQGLQTAHGLAGLIGLCVILVLLLHYVGFRFVFAIGGGAV